MSENTSVGEHTIPFEGRQNTQEIHEIAAGTVLKPEWIATLPGSKIENPNDYIEQIYVEHYKKLIGLLVSKGFDGDEAEDGVQTAIANFFFYMQQRNWEVAVEKPFYFLAVSAYRSLLDKRIHERAGKNVSIDDDENYFELSDNGQGWEDWHSEADDREFFNKIVAPYMQKFSEYETELMYLWMVENCWPRDVAVILNQSYEKTSIDMNRVKAKFRKRLKAACTSLDVLLEKLAR